VLNTIINTTFDPIYPSTANNVHRRMKGTKDQVRFERKAAISSHIALC
jgi:hypothetical protein